MTRQRRRGVEAGRFLTCALFAAASALLRPAVSAAPAAPDLFDEIYARSRGIEASLKTVTARFTETTTSSLLSRPLVAHGTLAVERPSRILLRYAVPESRTVLVDRNTLIFDWPSHALHQQTDIAEARARIEKYFLDKSPAELRRTFAITAVEANDRPGTWRITMDPKRKQIQQGLTRLELWIDRTSLLLSAMRMTFPSGDTKLMVFDDVVVNGPLDASVFSTPRPPTGSRRDR